MLLVSGRHPIGQKGHVDISLPDEKCLHQCKDIVRLSGLIEGNQFPSEAFEDGI